MNKPMRSKIKPDKAAKNTVGSTRIVFPSVGGLSDIKTLFKDKLVAVKSKKSQQVQFEIPKCKTSLAKAKTLPTTLQTREANKAIKD